MQKPLPLLETMFQIAHIVSHNRNRVLISNELNVGFHNYVATYNEYIIEAHGPFIQIKCERIHNIKEINNFVNRISRTIGAYDNEINRTIITIYPNDCETEDDSTDEECETDSEYEYEEEDYDW